MSDRDRSRIQHRQLLDGQSCVVHTIDTSSGQVAEVHRTTDVLLEAPNWVTPGELILNGDGVLWRLDVTSGALVQLDFPRLPDLNNDHVLAPGDTDVMYVSGFDWHVHRLSLATAEHHQVTQDDPSRPMRHFLHGVSPDGSELAYVGVEPGADGPWGAANIFTIPVAGGASRQLTFGDRRADGPEYSPDGEWIYFNTEAFTTTPGHAQIARMRPDGSKVEQRTFDERVNWFPHLAPTSPSGDRACYLSYPPGTIGHPENRPVELRYVTDGDWAGASVVARINGGQGTINVNSWHPDGRAFAFVSYPTDGV